MIWAAILFRKEESDLLSLISFGIEFHKCALLYVKLFFMLFVRGLGKQRLALPIFCHWVRHWVVCPKIQGVEAKHDLVIRNYMFTVYAQYSFRTYLLLGASEPWEQPGSCTHRPNIANQWPQKGVFLGLNYV